MTGNTLMLCTWVSVLFLCSSPCRAGVRTTDVDFSVEMYTKLTEGETKTIDFVFINITEIFDISNITVIVRSSDPDVASVSRPRIFDKSSPDLDAENWTGSFNISGNFLGYSSITLQLWGLEAHDETATTFTPILLAESQTVQVSVIRKPHAMDQIFSYTIATLVSIAFVNMGCSLDLSIVKATLKKPVGPFIGFCCQYFFMPLCSFGLGSLLLWHNAALQLGLFVTGCSPGGGGSNIWTYLLGGNLNLSITMTCLSTLAAFAMMPLWTLTLGRLVFTQSLIVVPYAKVATLAAGLAVPLLIGIGIRRASPKAGLILVKMLKPVSGLFILFVVGFGTYANLYLFQLMDWRVLLCGMLLPWIGFAFGAVASTIFQQPWTDSLAVAIETGVQNTGVAIFILRLTLEQPAADINTAVPVAVALMTPLPLLTIWSGQRCYQWMYGNRKDRDQSCSNPDLQTASSDAKLTTNEKTMIDIPDTP